MTNGDKIREISGDDATDEYIAAVTYAMRPGNTYQKELEWLKKEAKPEYDQRR